MAVGGLRVLDSKNKGSSTSQRPVEGARLPSALLSPQTAVVGQPTAVRVGGWLQSKHKQQITRSLHPPGSPPTDGPKASPGGILCPTRAPETTPT